MRQERRRWRISLENLFGRAASQGSPCETLASLSPPAVSIRRLKLAASRVGLAQAPSSPRLSAGAAPSRPSQNEYNIISMIVNNFLLR
jgi:hypothetical protein